MGSNACCISYLDQMQDMGEEPAGRLLKVALAAPAAADPDRISNAIKRFGEAPHAVRSSPFAQAMLRRSTAVAALVDWRHRFRRAQQGLGECLRAALSYEEAHTYTW